MAHPSEIDHAKDIYAALLGGWIASGGSLDLKLIKLTGEPFAEAALLFAEAFAQKARSASTA